MKKEINEYLKSYLEIEGIVITNEKKDYLVKKIDSIEKYNVGIACLHDYLSQCCFFKNGIMVYIFNNYLLTFNYEFNEFKSLYDYAEQNDIENGRKYLGNFLLSFQFSIESELYKNSDIYDDLTKTFYNCFPKREFYNDGKFVKDSLDYLNDLILNEKKILDINFFIDNIIKLFNRAKNENKYKLLFDALLDEKKRLVRLFDYDYNFQCHRAQYNEYISANVQEFRTNSYKFEAALDLLNKAYGKNILNEETYVDVLNQLILEINEVKSDVDDTVSVISRVNQIISAFNIIKKCREFYQKYQVKIEHCIKIILFYKRRFLKDEENNTSMSKIEHKFEIDEKMFEDIEKAILKNYNNVFYYLKIDFDAMLESAISAHSDHPLINMITHVSINAEQGTYFYWNKKTMSSFSIYYNKKGKEILNDLSNELINKYTGDYYYLMINYISMTFTVGGQIMASRFKDLFNEKFREYICNEILGVEGEAYKNDYVLCTYLIICIERLIYDQMTDIKLQFHQNKMYLNLEMLFDYYIENKFSRDVYMFTNFVLYDELGMEYRNNFMHGNFIHNKDLTVELLYIFSCVIGLLVVGSRNEKSSIK